MRPTLIIMDDLEDEPLSPSQRRKLGKWYNAVINKKGVTMAKMTHLQFAAGLIAAALAFKHEAEAKEETEKLRALASDSEEPQPAEHFDEDLWEQFCSFVESKGIPENGYNTDILCFAGLREGEPSFTLRGQDILASMLTRHWISLYEGLSPRVNDAKLNEAEAIAEKMEMYDKQRWAD